MPHWLIAMLCGGAFGLVFGLFVTRKSEAEKPIRGGMPAKVFHYLGASMFVATAPTVLIGAGVFRYGLIRDLALAFAMLSFAALLLLIHAAFEAQAAPGTVMPSAQNVEAK